ncbi:MAG: thiamine pyrophosphate-dependent enzyme, partial [Nitriliruptoraceae bacterium]
MSGGDHSRVDPVQRIEAALDAAIATTEVAPAAPRPVGEPLVPGASLTVGAAVSAFEDQVTSRELDVVARELRAEGEGYYTISSAGHEDDVVLGALTRPGDPALLHYRSGAFVLARARRAGATDQVDAVLHSLMADRDDPVSRGRHKVWGSRERWIVPQTSTIGSQVPKSVGLAVALGRRRTMGVLPTAAADVPHDAIVVCSFGDASLNHASTLSGLNAARWARRAGLPVPLLLVCEDNGIGISTPTPRDWVERTVAQLPGIAYVRAGGELHEVAEAAQRAVERARTHRTPVFLHLETVRLLGHAGSDVELGYRSREQIEVEEGRDPVARTARQLLSTGAATRAQLEELVASVRHRLRARARELRGAGHLETAAEVVGPLAPHHAEVVRASLADQPLDADARREIHPRGRLPEEATTAGQRTLAGHLNAALHDELLRRPQTVVFGEDVGVKGGVYGITSGLQRAFGRHRVFDTLLDETSILGLAQGFGLLGMLPIAEIQYLAYVHNALDQLRGEACSTAFFSDGRFTNPMVVRLPGLAYQKGFGGHFHNDDSIGALRDIPGLAIAVPARGDDAVGLLRGALGMAAVDGRVVALVEPIALYHRRDLHDEGDQGWLTDHPAAGEVLLPGEVARYHAEAEDVLVVTYGNGVPMALRAARRLAREGIALRVVDLRWLAPLPHEAVVREAATCRSVLVADEARATGGGIADAVLARLAEVGYSCPVASVRSHDSYVPLGPAADAVLLAEDDVVAAARALHERSDTQGQGAGWRWR